MSGHKCIEFVVSMDHDAYSAFESLANHHRITTEAMISRCIADGPRRAVHREAVSDSQISTRYNNSDLTP